MTQITDKVARECWRAYYRANSGNKGNIRAAIERYIELTGAKQPEPPRLMRPMHTECRVDVHQDYRPLFGVLTDALEQAQDGKGRERHGNGLPFMDQPMIRLGRMTGPGGPVFQAMKKAQEALGMLGRGDREAAERELLGAINYLAGAVLLVREGGE